MRLVFAIGIAFLHLLYIHRYLAIAASVPTSVVRARQEAQQQQQQQQQEEQQEQEQQQKEQQQEQSDGGTCPSSHEDTCGSSSSSNRSPPSNYKVECGVFMAPSTLGNNSNLGIFSGIHLKKGEVVNYPEIAIPILFRDFDDIPPNSLQDGNLWDRYLWGGHVLTNIDPIDDYNRDRSRSVFVPGVGCTVNSMLDLDNINSTSGSVYDTVSVPRDHPAAGSFTPYHESSTIAIRDIEIGTELVANYGDEWIPSIPNIPVTLNKHLNKADDFLQEYTLWLKRLAGRYGEELSTSLMDKLWTLTRNLHQSRDFSVLPKELNWNEIIAKAGIKEQQQKSHVNSREYWRSKTIRSIEWLYQNGRCQDHIKNGKSTIPNAGRGAFASRYLPKGTIVGYAPLIHVGELASDLMQWTYFRNSQKEYSKPELVINYSFGHGNSTVLLTPYGAGVNYINHASPPYKPNVRIQWPKEEMLAHKPDWLQKNVEYLRDTTNKVGLSFEYVALKDILEGEEIFMDYGDEWQKAWDDHVATYKPPVDAHTYVHSSQFQSNELKTVQELQVEPYPTNLHTLCKPDYRKDNRDGKNYFKKVLRRDDRYVSCHVLERNDDLTYTVQLTVSGIIVHKVPRPTGVELFDKAFSQDMHQPQAFRHHLYIPDDIFPESWKNKI